MNDFGNPYYSDTENYKALEERTFKVSIDGVQTTITCKFHNGILVTFSSTSEKLRDVKIKKPPPKKPTDRFIKKRG